MGSKQRTNSTQDTTASENVFQQQGQTQNQNTTGFNNTSGYARNVLDPYYNKQFINTSNDYSKLLGNFSNSNAGLNNLLTTGPNIQYSNGFSPIVTNAIARGQERIMGQSNAANNALASQLTRAGSGNNANLLAAIKARSQIANAGAMNSLSSDALSMQEALDQSRNATELQKFQSLLSGYGQQQAGYGQQLSGYGNLLSSLGGMAQAGATRMTGESSKMGQNVNSNSTSYNIANSNSKENMVGTGKVKKSYF